MATYNTAWTTYEARNESQSYYATKEVATKRALSHLMSNVDDYDREHFKWSDVGSEMGYWTHEGSGNIRFIESIKIFLGE